MRGVIGCGASNRDLVAEALQDLRTPFIGVVQESFQVFSGKGSLIFGDSGSIRGSIQGSFGTHSGPVRGSIRVRISGLGSGRR